MLAYGIGKREFPGLGQLRDSHRGKHLVHRPKVELGIQVDRRAGRLVGDAGGLTRDSYSIFRDEKHAGEFVFGCQRIKVTLKLLGRVSLGLD